LLLLLLPWQGCAAAKWRLQPWLLLLLLLWVLLLLSSCSALCLLQAWLRAWACHSATSCAAAVLCRPRACWSTMLLGWPVPLATAVLLLRLQLMLYLVVLLCCRSLPLLLLGLWLPRRML
jgi:hypothetical protein